MERATTELLELLEIEGTSACAHTYDCVTEPFGDADVHNFSECPRAAWWIVKRTQALDQIRERLVTAMERSGVAADRQNTSSTWTPHARIGSFHYSNSALDGVIRWWGVPLPGPAIQIPSAPTRLEVEKLHFTNRDTQPRSLGLVWSYRAK